MRHGDELTGKEKRLLNGQGYDPKYFMHLGKDAESFNFVEVTSGK
jgi:hypothetical protein